MEWQGKVNIEHQMQQLRCVATDTMEEDNFGISRIPSGVLGHIFTYLDPVDRKAVSEVSVKWKEIDSSTRTSVRVANCFSVAPSTMSNRFPKLDTLAIEGHTPRWCMESYFEPWVREIAATYKEQLKCLWVMDMVVTDSDLMLLSKCCSKLTSLKLWSCLGFTPIGLASITKHCRVLEVLDLDSSRAVMPQEDRPEWDHVKGMWLRNLAGHSKLRELNIAPWSADVKSEDIELILKNCGALSSLRLSVFIRFRQISEAINKSTSLVELGPGTFRGISQTDPFQVTFPSSVTSLRGVDLHSWCLPINHTTLVNLRRLEIYKVELNPPNYSEILSHCSNLEKLLVPDDLGDDGLLVVANTCVNLKEITVLNSGDPYAENAKITPRGIIPLVQSCGKLQLLEMCVSELDNSTLAAIGSHCPALEECSFRHVKLALPTQVDEGVKLLLCGCRLLTTVSFSLGYGALTNTGLTYLGQHGEKLKSIHLYLVGESNLGDLDSAMLDIARGCKNLEKLQLEGCYVTEMGLADAVRCSNSVKYVLAIGRAITDCRGHLLAQCRQDWVVEYGASHMGERAILGYSTITHPRGSDDPAVTVLKTERDRRSSNSISARGCAIS